MKTIASLDSHLRVNIQVSTRNFRCRHCVTNSPIMIALIESHDTRLSRLAIPSFEIACVFVTPRQWLMKSDTPANQTWNSTSNWPQKFIYHLSWLIPLVLADSLFIGANYFWRFPPVMRFLSVALIWKGLSVCARAKNANAAFRLFVLQRKSVEFTINTAKTDC